MPYNGKALQPFVKCNAVNINVQRRCKWFAMLCYKSVKIMNHKNNIDRENLAMKIMLLANKIYKGDTTFDEALKEAVKIIEQYEVE